MDDKRISNKRHEDKEDNGLCQQRKLLYLKLVFLFWFGFLFVWMKYQEAMVPVFISSSFWNILSA